ncbi:MAG: hypothetical protein WCP97_06655 [bacterium]
MSSKINLLFQMLLTGLVLIGTLAVSSILKVESINLVLTLILLTFVSPSSWTLLRKAVFSLILFFLTVIAIGYLSSLLHYQLFPVHFSFVINAISLIIIIRKKEKCKHTGIVNMQDLFSVIMVVLFISGFCYVLKSFSDQGRVLFRGNNTDAEAHLAIYSTIMDQHEYLYLLPLTEYSSYIRQFQSYPQGMHYSSAVVAWYVTDSAGTKKVPLLEQITIFTGMTGIFFALFIFYFLRVFFNLLEERHKIKYEVLLFVALLMLYPFFDVFYSLMTYGFYPQIASLLFLLILLDVYTGENSFSAFKLFISYFALVGITACWYFLTPVAIGMIIYCQLVNNANKTKIFFISLLSVLLTLVQISFYNIFNNAQNLMRGVNNSGGVSKIPLLFTVCLIIAATLYLYRTYKISEKSKTLAGATVLSFLFSVLIYSYQIYSKGQQNYYYFKSEYIIAVIASLVFLMLFTELLSYLLKKINKFFSAPRKKGIQVLVVFLESVLLMTLVTIPLSSALEHTKSALSLVSIMRWGGVYFLVLSLVVSGWLSLKKRYFVLSFSSYLHVVILLVAFLQTFLSLMYNPYLVLNNEASYSFSPSTNAVKELEEKYRDSSNENTLFFPVTNDKWTTNLLQTAIPRMEINAHYLPLWYKHKYLSTFTTILEQDQQKKIVLYDPEFLISKDTNCSSQHSGIGVERSYLNKSDQQVCGFSATPQLRSELVEKMISYHLTLQGINLSEKDLEMLQNLNGVRCLSVGNNALIENTDGFGQYCGKENSYITTIIDEFLSRNKDILFFETDTGIRLEKEGLCGLIKYMQNGRVVLVPEREMDLNNLSASCFSNHREELLAN